MTEATGVRMSPAGTAVKYVLDAGVSRITVRAFATGLFSSMGHNPTLAVRGYSGEAEFVPGNLEQARVRISVEAASLEVTDDVSQSDRADIENRTRQDVLETSTYPEIVFESSQITPNMLSENRYAANVVGNLTLHGVTRSETILAQVTVAGDTLRAGGEFTLRQTDYGIKLVSVAGGALKVKDELKITFDLTARRKEG
jgi:polyisoprenoid-binding protein YceI